MARRVKETVIRLIRTTARTAFNAFFPRRCSICGRDLTFLVDSGDPLCDECLSALVMLEGERCSMCSTPLLSELQICTRCRVTEYHFKKNYSLFPYDGTVRELIYQYKFKGRKNIAAVFARFLAEAYRQRFKGETVVLAPPGTAGVKTRGWDHVAVVGGVLRKRYNVPVVRCLKRLPGAAQKELNFSQRKENIRGKISCTGKNLPVGGAVLLLDDVFTTGVTADECSSVLLRAGVGSVSVLTIAIDE